VPSSVATTEEETVRDLLTGTPGPDLERRLDDLERAVRDLAGEVRSLADRVARLEDADVSPPGRP
jgi:hypothetical protein